MMLRILLAGLVGAIFMFAWNFVAHMLLPIGDMGVSEIPNESSVTSAMVNSMGSRPGFYIFPGPGLGPNPTKAEKDEAMKRMAEDYATKATGILVYRPPSDRPFNFPKWLLREFAFELVEAILAAWLLAQAGVFSFGKRVVFVTVIGIIAAITVNLSYWNWYGFPKEYTIGQIVTRMIAFLCAGIGIAIILKPRRAV
jgi:hypothetical protein